MSVILHWTHYVKCIRTIQITAQTIAWLIWSILLIVSAVWDYIGNPLLYVYGSRNRVKYKYCQKYGTQNIVLNFCMELWVAFLVRNIWVSCVVSRDEWIIYQFSLPRKCRKELAENVKNPSVQSSRFDIQNKCLQNETDTPRTKFM